MNQAFIQGPIHILQFIKLHIEAPVDASQRNMLNHAFILIHGFGHHLGRHAIPDIIHPRCERIIGLGHIPKITVGFHKKPAMRHIRGCGKCNYGADEIPENNAGNRGMR